MIESREPSGSDPSLATACQRLAELASLEPDWDSYRADPPTAPAVVTARRLIEALARHASTAAGVDSTPYFIAPIPTGGVQLEWTSPANEIEVEVGPDAALSYLLISRDGDTERERGQRHVSQAEMIDAVASVLDL
jgi:hypothetical protein